jgi:hypothetical protein
MANTLKLSAHSITQQQSKHLGARQFQRKHKKAADGLPGYLALKILHQSKKSSVAKQLTATAHVQTEQTLSGSKSE